MSGEQSSVDKKREDIEKILNSYITNLVPIDNPDAGGMVTETMALQYEQIKGLSPEEAVERSFVLKKQVLKVRLEQNLHKARIKWATKKVNQEIAENYDGFGQYDKHEMKGILLARTNSYVRDLMKVIEYAELYCEMLDGICYDITSIANSLEEICKTKRYNK